MLDAGAARMLTRLALAVALLLGIALLAMALGPHRVGDYFTETDFYGGYADGARALQRGHLDPARYGVVGPGYEVALALVGLLVRDLLLAAELLSVLAVVAGALLWFRLLARRADARLAFVALLFLATNGTLFRYGYSVTTDALAFALQALALLLLLAHARPRAALLAGSVAALAFLTRYSAAYLLPAGLVALLAGGTLQPRRARAALLFAAGFAALVVPWMLFSLAHGGTLASQLHHNIAYDVFARARGIPWDDYQKLLQSQFRSLGDVIARDPAAVARRELFNVWDHLRLDARDLLGWPVAAAAAVGIVLAALDGTLRRLWPLWLAGALAFLILVPVFYSQRYSLPLLPVYAALAAAAFASPRLALVVRRGPKPWLKPLLAALPLALAAQASARLQARVIDQLPVEILECARTLKAEARPGDRVIARKPHIAFHAGVEAVPFPFTKTLPELADYARARRARWLFFSWPEAQMRPDYFYLLDTSGVVPGLTVRNASSGHPAILYEIGPEFGTAPVWLANDTLAALHTSRARLLVDPRDVRALYTLGFIERTRGRYGEARLHLERAARLKPNDLATALLLGEVYLMSDDARRAADAYRQALSLDPTSVAAQVGLGWAALIAHRPADAARIWRGLIALTRDGATLQRMAELYHAMGDPAAETEARAALARLGGPPPTGGKR
ncbi:MAG: glycosyltransferase family 39 protein [Candidatus Eisenbacteria bacterium]